MEEKTISDTHTDNHEDLSPQTLYLAKATLALSFVFVGAWLLTARVFPLFDTVLPFTREICTIVFGVTMAIAALIATYYPRLLKSTALYCCSTVFMAGGTLMIIAGVALGSALVLAVGASLTRIGIIWIQIMVGVSFIEQDARSLSICIVVALALSYAEQGILMLLPEVVSLVAFIVLPVLAGLLVLRMTRPVFSQINASESPRESAVTKPYSFLPFSHNLFICFFMFRVIYGYTLCFGEVNGTPLVTLSAVIPVLIIAAIIVFLKRRLNPDILFLAAALLTIAGLLLVPITATIGIHATISNILASGVACFDILFWFVLVSIAARNKNGAVSVFAWGSSVAAFGIIAGAFLGRTTNQLILTNPVLVSLITSGLLLVFICYMFITIKRFSFVATITNVVPDTAALIPTTNSQLLEKCCNRVAENYSLTPRETEVLVLLARGRSGRFIQDALVISHNTVKAHVKHIYGKLDIHTHQELVDLIEQNE